MNNLANIDELSNEKPNDEDGFEQLNDSVNPLSSQR